MRRILSALLGALVLAALAACGAPQLKGTVLDPPSPAPDFTLTDEQGQPFTLSEQRGKVVVLFFGFTSCPDICPAELSNLAAATRQLGDAASDVQVALVSLDPERDTSERLAQYVGAFDPSFKGLRGDAAALAPVARDYGVFYEKRELPGSALGYTIDHSGYVYVIDKAGRWREVIANGAPVADLVSDLRALTRERD
ncbi:MAG TPA: SCO family protein [Chloroflexaceae bacterium]|nr:SCO family protein [Chloroflexaceae bacterium]